MSGSHGLEGGGRAIKGAARRSLGLMGQVCIPPVVVVTLTTRDGTAQIYRHMSVPDTGDV